MFGIYVPDETPVVRVSTVDVPSRAQIGFVRTVVVRLGPALEGFPLRYRIAVGGDRLYGIDLVDGELLEATIGEVSAGAVRATASETSVEFAISIAATQSHVLLASAGPPSLYVLDHAGNTTDQTSLPSSLWRMAALRDDTYVALEVETGVVARYDQAGEEITRYTVFQLPEERLGGEANLWPQQDFAVGQSRIYVTTAEEYRVSALDPDSKSVWVLEGDGERVSIPEHLSGRTLGRTRRAGRAAGATIDDEYSQALWPEFYPALSRIAADARDRLYVFPYVTDESIDQFPVDIFDANGQLLTQAWLPFQGWDASAGDSIYRIEEEDGETIVVRYELQLPSAGRPAIGQ